MGNPSLNDILAANLARLMDRSGHKQASLAKQSGVGQTTISLYLNPSRRQPSKSGKMPSAKFSEVEALAAVFGVPPWELLRPHVEREDGSRDKRAADQPARRSVVDMDAAPDEFPMAPMDLMPWEGGKTTRQEERERSLAGPQGVVENVSPGEPYAANDKFEKVAELADVRLAAGDGIENESELVTGSLQFRRSFLREVGADGGRGVVVYAKGNSMAPLIQDGAALLVVPSNALTVRDLAAGGVYAINYDGKMIVKSVARSKDTGRWVARSMNAAYPDIDLENGAPVRLLGRVVWVGFKL